MSASQQIINFVLFVGIGTYLGDKMQLAGLGFYVGLIAWVALSGLLPWIIG